MPRRSAGLLVYNKTGGRLRVFLVHPGGPFWTEKDEGAWSIPKGEFAEGEDPLATAIREFGEETGQAVAGDFVALPPCRQAGGKIVHAWAVEGDVDAAALKSNLFTMEWPRGSGRIGAHQALSRSRPRCLVRYGGGAPTGPPQPTPFARRAYPASGALRRRSVLVPTPAP